MKVKEQEVFDILTGKISSTINRALLRAFSLEDLNITTEQWSVLSSLWKEDKITQQQLCDLTRKDKPSMTRLLDNLQKSKLVVRVAHPSDRRINLIHLTALGVSIKDKVMGIVSDVVDTALSGISDEEISISRNVLTKIIQNLDSINSK
ncbi:MAG: MarR family winged helix-turn-helix transcriptional regulator [Dysgonamonadaceae bacterium]|nr:MarR family winged helix-turn-helix transcriptional regulator [Dysgonamonadaceae bacterium]MDD4727486.1 MarR family winged helix-turn-helix transcriptional regulator [Dysgonamonadaceae bacterium]